MRFAVGMSGGVDSTVAALLLRDAGHEVVGLTMQVWDGRYPVAETGRSSCYGPDEPAELAAVKELATNLGVPHRIVPLAEEYRRQVLDYFRREYLAGRTPNPCVQCNRTMKFGLLPAMARQAGIAFDLFATGHYARVEHVAGGGRHCLRRATDATKDQSYFLSRLTQEQLAATCFPLGEMTKQEVRAMARERGLERLADQAESQDFMGGGDCSPLFADAPVAPGPILDRQGRELGRHRGIVHYTIGQRHGLGIGGHAEPLRVVAIDAVRNAVIVGNKDDLQARRTLVRDVNWIAIPGLDGPLRAEAQIRLRSAAAAATIAPAPQVAPDAVEVVFDQPQTAITPGQAAVFYRDDLVLGGGWITLEDNG